MENLKSLTPLQLVIAAAGSLTVGCVLLSNGHPIGYVLLMLAAACGIGAYGVSRKRRA